MSATAGHSPEMITETSDLRVLHCVVKHMSYAKAADELGLSPSGVSRVISRLEERLGVRLLQRTTRKLSLTEAGAAFVMRTQQVLLDLSDAEAEVQETALTPRGKVKMTASVAFGNLHLIPLLTELVDVHPELSVEVNLVDRFVDLIEEGVDLAIRIGKLADSRLVARRLCTNERVLVASPAYLARWGEPQQPADLSRHECVLFTGFAKPSEWRLVGCNRQEAVQVTGRLASNNIEVLTTAAKRGRGITLGATLSVAPALQSGELVRVLCDWRFEPTAVYAVYPSARQLSTKVRATVDFLADKLQDPPIWDRQLAGAVVGF